MNPLGTITSHRNTLKEFKTTCRTKKNNFWQNKVKKLNKIENDKDFRSKWKQMGEDITLRNTLPNVDGVKWDNYVKSLFRKVEGREHNT